MPGPFHWAGPTDQYFAAVFIPDDPAATAMVTLRNPLSIARDSRKDRPKERMSTSSAPPSATCTAPPRSASSSVPRNSKSCRKFPSPALRCRQRSQRPGRFRLVGHHRQAALRLAEVDLSPHRPQLGMGHRPPDPDHQPGPAAAAHHADEVDAEDAARRAADQVDPGEV